MKRFFIIIPLVIATGVLLFPFVAYSGHQIMVITSDSMLPVLKPNDLIVVKPSSIDEIKEGDIIAFDSHLGNLGIIAHRAIEIYDDHGSIGIDTKGDNEDKEDPWVVHDVDLIGKVVQIIPDMGILLVGIVRYFLVAIIIITSIFLLREIMTEHK